MASDPFGLSEKPFQLTPDARFYYESRTHKKAMAYLGFGLSQGEGFITITGDIGAGKSTLVAHLMATIDRARLNAISIVSTQVEGDDMLRLAAQGMGLQTHNVAKAQLLDRVEAWLGEQFKAKKRTVLIVDEAQNLPVSALEELRMLSNFQIGGRALLQIFLLGQPEFRDKLTKAPELEQLRQRIIATHHLGPIEADEVEPYIRHRLGVAGWKGSPEFDPAAFTAIHLATGGIPRRINQLASRLMLQAFVDKSDRIGAQAVEAVVDDLAADTPKVASEAVIPLRTAPTPAAPVEPGGDPLLERRVAELEAQLEEQERAVRRVLALLVDWVENAPPAVGYRHNAA